MKEEAREEKLGTWVKTDQIGRSAKEGKENVNPNSKREGH